MANLKVISPDNLGAEFDLGVLIPNKVSVKKGTSGLAGIVKLAIAASYPAPLNDTDAATAAFVKAAIDAAVLALPADKFLQNASYSSSTKLLTLTLSAGSPITLSLSDLIPITPASSHSISVTGLGTAAFPVTADLIVDPVVGNLQTVSATGSAVLPSAVKALATIDIQDAFGNHIGYAFA